MQHDIEGYGVDDDKIITKEGMPQLRTNLSDRPVPFLSTILISFFHVVVVAWLGHTIGLGLQNIHLGWLGV